MIFFLLKIELPLSVFNQISKNDHKNKGCLTFSYLLFIFNLLKKLHKHEILNNILLNTNKHTRTYFNIHEHKFKEVLKLQKKISFLMHQKNLKYQTVLFVKILFFNNLGLECLIYLNQ